MTDTRNDTIDRIIDALASTQITNSDLINNSADAAYVWATRTMAAQGITAREINARSATRQPLPRTQGLRRRAAANAARRAR